MPKYKLGYVKRGSTAFKVQKDGCGVPSAARALLGPEELLITVIWLFFARLILAL